MTHSTKQLAKPKRVPASKLKVERLQTRAATDEKYIAELVERLQAGDKFPPIIIVSDGSTRWLVDGAHRLDAAIKLNTSISILLLAGNRTKAIELACGANKSHGLRRTNADKRHAVRMTLRELGQRSDRAIAELCFVSNHLVAQIRKQSGGNSPTSSDSVEHLPKQRPKAKRTGKDGKTYPANTRKPRVQPLQSETDFNPKTLEEEAASTPPQKQPKSGKPIVGAAQRKECKTSLRRLIQSLQSVGIYDEFLTSLDQIAERIEQL